MTPSQLELVPDDLLSRKDTRPLLDYLAARGQRMTLLELDNERHKRGLTKRTRPMKENR